MVDILVAMAQHAREEQEAFLRGIEATNHESNLSTSANGKALEKDKPKRKLVRLASREVIPDPYSARKEWRSKLTRDELKETVKKIRHNIEALRTADVVETTMTTSRIGNEPAVELLNKTIEINNSMVNNEGNEDMRPCL